MRSQKKSNKAPRPFKNKSDGVGWSGGNRNDAFIPSAKPGFRVKKAGTAPTEKASASETETSSETSPTAEK